MCSYKVEHRKQYFLKHNQCFSLKLLETFKKQCFCEKYRNTFKKKLRATIYVFCEYIHLILQCPSWLAWADWAGAGWPGACWPGLGLAGLYYPYIFHYICIMFPIYPYISIHIPYIFIHIPYISLYFHTYS